MNETILIRAAELDGRLVDVAWADGTVIDVVPTGRLPSTDTTAFDADGGAVIPGLHDHHIHLMSLAAARRSVAVGPPEVNGPTDFAAVLARACRTAGTGWVRAVGYHESVAGPLDADLLEQLVPESRDVPVRVQHRSGQLWVFNRTALGRLGPDDLGLPGPLPTDGRLFGLDERLAGHLPSTPLDLEALGDELASYGVTGVTDLTPFEAAETAEHLASRVSDPAFPIRVHITGGPDLAADVALRVPRGPVKLLPPDHADPDLDLLVEQIASAHAEGRNVAIHCVTRVGLVVALSAWQTSGARVGDRIEHGAVIGADLVEWIRELGLIVVTQPNFVSERGDRYLEEVAGDEIGDLWRCRTLIDHGIPLAAGTDAPFGHPDPWRAIAAAVHRTTWRGSLLGERERITPRTALELFLGNPGSPHVPRQVAPGSKTDLCLLDQPLGRALGVPDARRVVATIGRAGIHVPRP